ncbi:Gfo/Idh/MocA family protein [Tessaracoccus caeni]|uniref:Gfo/Idh/MocA family protein n=1 Tax=Tessaracoccus caeni TaxID=3031239 RepID=UPI0023DA010C|nr:Gfo/Idh/MocA family oxidoreductase [Tessaracoccus caeni]MDF1488056.1 Gfo/Idh/MocA family oxidoreductase [Tessaracoccus caeni]
MSHAAPPTAVALLGIGRIGIMHARILVAHPRVERLILADVDEARATQAAAELGCESATVDQVLDPTNALGLSGLIIATGTSTHADLLVRASQTGVATYCEKPIALTLEDAERASRALEDAKLPHHIGFQRRFDDGYNRAKKLLDSGELGELRRFHALTCDQFPPADEFIPGSGGIFLDCNVHDFDILRWVTGREVVEVYATGSARGSKVYEESNDFSDAVAILTFDDGTVGSVHSSRFNGQGHEVRLDLMGTKGAANVGLDNKVPFRSVEDDVAFPPDEPWYDFIERFRPCYERELDHFLTSTMNGGPSACTASDAVEALRIALACVKSRDEHRPVRLSEIS